MNNIQDLIKNIHDKSQQNSVPIIKDEGLKALIEIVREKDPKNILEIGTAVGYSSIMMALNSKANIDTIERNEEMVKEAKKNVLELGLEKRIQIHFCDALKIDIETLKKEYDIIFIDAAKAQSKKFFLLFSPLLARDGVIITDNILFHGLVKEYIETGTLEKGSKDLKSLVRKINEYVEWLKANPLYETKFLEIGDGLAISYPRKD